MPDYQFNTNLGPAPQQGTSLGDLINTARGVQAYQQAEQLNPLAAKKAQMEIEQAQQLNPLAVQQKQMEIEQANKMNPLAVRKSTAEAGTAETGAKKSVFELTQNQSKVINENIGSVLNDERLVDPNPQRRATPLLEARQRAINSGVDPVMAEMMFAPFIDKAFRDNNPTAVKDMMSGIKNVQQAGIGAVGQQALQNPDVVEVNGVKYNRNKQTGSLELISMRNNVSAVATNAPTAPNAPTVKSSLVRQDMPVASGGVPQMNTQQTARFEEGQTLQKESTALVQAAQEAKQTSRKIKENIAAAAGSAPGQALRSAGKFIAGSEQLDELIKNLADNQMRQAALMGASSATDQARQVLALANGSENITPQALAQIVQRADATSTALEKFNAGLNKYYEKAGTYNGPIHARNFKQTWAENYDPRIFMVQNINASDMSGAEKQIQLQAVLKGTSEEERRALAKKAETIKRLEKGDF